MAAVGANSRNRLSSEKSPYLLQHADNPVDWFPWGDEAIRKAKAENKPIFLSVGYSTCHWCHVMERESFSQDDIAAILNRHFVCIKVDREERPDVDRVYMTFLQATSNEGGWPMNVWLTPDLHPFVAGTYFPAKESTGRKAFADVIKEVGRQWAERRQAIIEQGSQILASLLKASVDQMDAALAIPTTTCVMKCFEELKVSFDVENGGFGNVPKFSQPATFNFLLRLYATNPYSDHGQQALTMTLLTLRKMAEGGVHDHIGNGFHRYSTDKYWHVPHFEKMLYDQAQLCVSYIEAYQITKDVFFAEMARDILTYIARDLSDSEGGFYSAEDAESLPQIADTQKMEGAFCCWREDEIRQLLPQVVEGTCIAGRCISFWEVFCYHYCVVPEGNVPPELDSHGDLKMQNVLKVRCTMAETAQHFSLPVELVEAVIAQSKRVLLQTRRLRPRPHRDEKIVTGWNGLAISAFARAGQVLCDEECMQRAVNAARFIEIRMYNSTTGRLKRNSYRHSGGTRELGISSYEGFSPDYAYLIRGLIDLYEVTFDDHWIEWAVQLQDIFDSLFWDNARGGYFDFAEGDPSVLLRLKEDSDGTEPTSSSVACSNLLRLAEYAQNPIYIERAQATFTAFGQRLENFPTLLPEMMSAFLLSSKPVSQLCLVGSCFSMEWKELLNAIHSNYVPCKTIAYVPTPNVYVARQMPTLQGLAEGLGRPQVYICTEGTCHPPTHDPITIANLLTPSPPQPSMPADYTFELSDAVAL